MDTLVWAIILFLIPLNPHLKHTLKVRLWFISNPFACIISNFSLIKVGNLSVLLPHILTSLQLMQRMYSTMLLKACIQNICAAQSLYSKMCAFTCQAIAINTIVFLSNKQCFNIHVLLNKAYKTYIQII